MARRSDAVGFAIGPLLLFLLAGCQATDGHVERGVPVRNTISSSLRVPIHIQRLAVLYPKPHHRALTDAYSRLESAALQLKEQRPFLQIVDRVDLAEILGEQRLQIGGSVYDDSAVRIGRLLGVDSVLIYRIESPSLRDQVWARYSGVMPPLTVTSKIILVESGEVVFHNVVTAPMGRFAERAGLLLSGMYPEPHLLEAVDRGVSRTIADLRHAFQY